VPVTLAHGVLTVALADPTNVLALDDIRLATKLASVRTAVATASDVQEAVARRPRRPRPWPRSGWTSATGWWWSRPWPIRRG
jgi:hypothetical protein